VQLDGQDAAQLARTLKKLSSIASGRQHSGRVKSSDVPRRSAEYEVAEGAPADSGPGKDEEEVQALLSGMSDVRIVLLILLLNCSCSSSCV
jgi:hypothetical protein